MRQRTTIMFLRSPLVKFISFCVIISFVISLLIAALPTNLESCNCENYLDTHNSIHEDVKRNKFYNAHLGSIDKPKLAILVPFRDRFDELLQFAPHLTDFLKRQQIPHHIFVLNQADRYRFNRASLINTGFLYTQHDFDYIAMHDVDLLPLNDKLNYSYPKEGSVFHVAAPDLHPKYGYPNFVGGILLVNREDFRKVNGMSNRYWGWGLEDDEFFVRLKESSIAVKRPENVGTGKTDTFKHIHDKMHRKRDTTKCYNQREVTRKRDRETGLDTLKYEISSRNMVSIDDVTVTVLNIKLYCDTEKTPWCDCEGAPPEAKTKRKARASQKS
ncbi:beta-1,4-galactosyltransferase 7-like [Culicoides brevitarsis]|uniref:beta-1,4-galactosyltransferase 7-like n=1 Tax=Culicoides brevitarsis TaxID=469753 RepID=UPI00307C86FE